MYTPTICSKLSELWFPAIHFGWLSLRTVAPLVANNKHARPTSPVRKFKYGLNIVLSGLSTRRTRWDLILLRMRSMPVRRVYNQHYIVSAIAVLLHRVFTRKDNRLVYATADHHCMAYILFLSRLHQRIFSSKAEHGKNSALTEASSAPKACWQ